MQYGTVKVGRWSYPAQRYTDPLTVQRNEKRDGTGAWEETNPALFIPIGEGDPATEKVAVAIRDADSAAATPQPLPEPEVPGFTPVEQPAPEPAKGAHGGKVGAQVKKPGKSTWKIGDKCPQGHQLTEETLYTMPSGRHQCRICRGTYRSNGSDQ